MTKEKAFKDIEYLHIKLDKKDKETIKENQEKSGVSNLSEYVRLRLLGRI